MKKRFFFIALVVTILCGACEKKQAVPFEFSLTAESVVEGNDLPVSLTVTRGAKDGYAMVSTVETYDMATSGTGPTDYVLMDGEVPAGGAVVDFEDYGKKDFVVKGMAAGTYKISVALSRDDYVDVSSVIVVIQKKGGGDEPFDPGSGGDDERKVTSFEIIGLPAGGEELMLAPGEQFCGKIVWTPDDVISPVFSVHSTNESVVSARVMVNIVVIQALAVGDAYVVVSEKGGVDVTARVSVIEPSVPVETLEVEGLQLKDKWLVLEDNGSAEYRLSWSPETATDVVFSARADDDSVASAVVEDGYLKITALYPGRTSVSVGVLGGPVVTIPVRVCKKVKVTVDWLELNATDTQLRTKTFPCYLRFRSDSDKAFPIPIVWSVTMKGVVNVSGEDTQSVTSKTDVSFYGNRTAQYDVTSNVLIPCYMIHRTADFTLSLTLSLQRNAALDPELWDVEYDYVYLTQEARIRQYITDIQQ